MGSAIFAIIVVVLSLAATLAKQRQQKQARQAAKGQSETGTYKENAAYKERSTYKEQPTYKSSYHYGSEQKGKNSTMKSRANSTQKAAEHARSNMTEQELKDRPSAQEFKRMAGVEASDGAILSAAKMHSLATELGNEYDSKEDLMAPVFDLMVKGPDTSVPNERDFVSEGMDMINTYTLES